MPANSLIAASAPELRTRGRPTSWTRQPGADPIEASRKPPSTPERHVRRDGQAGRWSAPGGLAGGALPKGRSACRSTFPSGRNPPADLGGTFCSAVVSLAKFPSRRSEWLPRRLSLCSEQRRSDVPRRQPSRREPSTQNSRLPSGSASTTHDCSPCPMSALVAPSESSRSTSRSRSPGRKSRCRRFLAVLRSGTETKSSPGIRVSSGRISNTSGPSSTTTQPSTSRHHLPKATGPRASMFVCFQSKAMGCTLSPSARCRTVHPAPPRSERRPNAGSAESALGLKLTTALSTQRAHRAVL